ncbi:MAG: 4-(cytidine 5'-diphospho)-2-C-methyl-D-erythritol kinase [Planctomycetes bacterium]|nr:4-(cytidine 5'-diphospho)-2-C-methyl-D-erythritol kinase [Planctomycetota bacterium]
MPPGVARVHCPAKVNLFLEVLGRRPDGYHEIATVMAPISLADTLELAGGTRANDRLEVRPKGAAPTDATNTALRTMHALRGRRDLPPVRIRLAKRIPAGAGLGGGSTDAAGALRAANRRFRLRLTVEEQASILAEVGSDTSFFAHGGWAVCSGRGERVTPLRPGRVLPLVVIAPPFENPTAEIYRRVRVPPQRRGVDLLVEALLHGRDLAGELFNRLEEPAFEYRPELARIKREMSELPFKAVLMTGSGSAIFGLCRDARQQRALAAECRRRGWGRVFAAKTENPEGHGGR